MNELEIIRSQIAVEQAHAAEVANALPEATAPSREACVSYLVWVLARFDELDQTLLELLSSRQSSANGAVAANARHLAGLIGRPGTSREALSRLEAALGATESAAAHTGWQEFVRFFNSAWVPRRAALEGALAQHLSVADLRTISAIDADSMLEERKLHARAVAHRS
ncbi:MAG TPA: hypothetical protein VHY36_08535 [Steroidobacteraceae bacterium]|jgi:hypothetical protein|nr:hypothetical protein [Steroidobacteraceae bacterium]